MNKIKASLLITAMLSAFIMQAQVSNKEEMVKKIFATFKNNDAEGFVRLFPNAEITKVFLAKTLAADTTIDAQMKQGIDVFMKLITDSNLQKGYRADYEKYRSRGEKKGVNWSNTTFTSYTGDSALQNDNGLKSIVLKGKIYFTADGKDYFMAYDEVVWFEDKGWYGVGIKQIDEKSKEAMATSGDANEDDNTTDPGSFTTDSLGSMDSVELVKPSKPVQKAKSKMPVKQQAKPKTQSPAKKPD